jgi:hypothetical protein
MTIAFVCFAKQTNNDIQPNMILDTVSVGEGCFHSHPTVFKTTLVLFKGGSLNMNEKITAAVIKEGVRVRVRDYPRQYLVSSDDRFEWGLRLSSIGSCKSPFFVGYIEKILIQVHGMFEFQSQHKPSELVQLILASIISTPVFPFSRNDTSG